MYKQKVKNKFDEAMLSVDEALDRVLKQIKVLETELVSLAGSLDCVLAEDIFSKINVPNADNILILDCFNRIDVTSANVNCPKFFNFSAIRNNIIGHPTRKPIE